MGSKFSILVVEDDQDYLEITYKSLEFYLSDSNFFYAINAERAVSLLDKRKFDLLILDLDLRHGGRPMTGHQLLHETKKLYPDMPIIIITGTRTKGVTIKLTETSLSGYNVREVLGKPVKMEKLEELVNRIKIESGKG